EHGGGGLAMNAISHRLSIPLDETEIHVDFLEKARLVAWETDQFDQMVWRRTKDGNRLVVAKRLSGEEPKETKKKHPDLSKPEEIALCLMAQNNGAGATEAEIAKELGISELAT